MLQHQRAHDLAAWIVLKNLWEGDVVNPYPYEPKDNFNISTVVPWPQEIRYTITLKKIYHRSVANSKTIESYEIFAVDSSSPGPWWKLPFEEYLIQRVNTYNSTGGVIKVFPKSWGRYNDSPNLDDPKPYYWNRTAYDLLSRGMDDSDPVELELYSKPVVEYFAFVDKQQFSLLGVPIGAKPLYIGIGYLLLIFALMMLGPIKRLGDLTPDKLDTPWTFLLKKGDTKSSYILELSIRSLLIAWALLPIAILAIQVYMAFIVNFGGPTLMSLVGMFGMVALAVSGIIQLFLAFRLHAIRNSIEPRSKITESSD